MKSPIRPNMNSIREHKLTDAVKELKHKPCAGILRAIDSKMFSLDGNAVFRYKPEVLALKEFERCLSLAERKLPNEFSLDTKKATMMIQVNLMHTLNAIMVKEHSNVEQLQEIAVKTIRELFDIPEHVNILPEIKNSLGNIDEQDDSPEAVLSLSPERQREMRDEIEKRVILNGLVHGSAMHIWKSVHYIVKEEVDMIHPLLMQLYDVYTSGVGFMMWQMPPELAMMEIGSHGLTQGKNELKFKKEGEAECDIECGGINFPVLLHEITKGAMDYLICHGIPKEYSEEELKYYYAKSDAYENEYWHYLLAPSLWTSFVEAAKLSTQEIPLAIARMTKLSYQDLSDVMKACIDSPEAGELKLKEFKIV